MIRLLLLSALLLPALPVVAQDVAPPPSAAAAPAPKYQTVRVRMDTAEGPIVLELETERAPQTAANFLKYVDQKKFDGTSFYRALTFPERADLGLVQGGIRVASKLLPAIPHEPTSKTGLTHDDAAISMARGAPGSAQADFFIILGGLPGLDANAEAAGDNAGYAVFGHVVEGMDVVRRILASPISPTEGSGVMKGQMIAKPVPILSARRLPK